MKNQKHLCTVGSDDVWMFSIGVWGDIWGPEASFLDVSGSSKRRDDGESDFLIWEMPHELVRSDRIEFCFEEGSSSSPKGKMFDPKDYPPEEPKIEMSFPPTDEDLTKLESRPALNAGLKWSFSRKNAPSVMLAPDTERQFVKLFIMWDEESPQRLRVSLTKKSLREITYRETGEEFFSEYQPLNSSLEISVLM